MAPRPDNRAFSALTGDALPPRAAPSVASAVAALTTLGTGFLAAHVNRLLRARLRTGTLSVADYYRQLQRLIFRWLVLLFAEERTNEAGQNLLHLVGTSAAVRTRYACQHALGRLRDLAVERSPSSSHSGNGHDGHDLFRSLERLTVRLHAGDRSLGLPAMLTFLFSRDATPELDRAALPDAVLLTALRHLCFIDDPARTGEGHRSPLDFGQIAGEQFGSLHESLLQLWPRIEHDRRQFSLGPAGGQRCNSAQTTPEHPSYVDAQLAADAWCSVFAWRKDATEPGRCCPTEAVFRDLPSDPKRLGPNVRREVERLRDEQRFFHWQLAFAEVFRPSSGDEPPDNQQLVGKDGKQCVSGGFDVILGNPPHGAECGKAARKLCKYLWQPAAETSNTAADFLVLSRGLLKAGGQAALILPKSLTYSHAWRTMRRLHLPEVTSVIDASRAWRDVRLEQVLLSFGGPLPVRTIACGQVVDRQVRWNRCVDKRTLDRLDILPTGLVDEDVELLEQLLDEELATLGSVCSTRRGTNVQRFRHPEGDVPLLAGRDIGPFAIRPRLAGLRRGDVPAARLHYAEPGQVVFQNIVAHLTVPAHHIWLTGAITSDRVACLDTVNLLRLHAPNANPPTDSRHAVTPHALTPHALTPHAVTPHALTPHAVTPHALCGLLMSDLVNWFVHVGVYNRAIRTMHFDGYFLDKIPLPPAVCFRSFHEAARAVHAQPDGCQAWTTLNSVVFDAFGVPRRLADYVMGSRKPRWKALPWPA